MNIALSNLAYDITDISALKKMKDLNINFTEVALTKISNWNELDYSNINLVGSILKTYNISYYSIQSLFYGVKIENLNQSDLIINHLSKIIDYGKSMNVKKLVFGSPMLRKNWSEDTIKTFHLIDESLSGSKMELLIEPNSIEYGSEYFFNLKEIVDFIKINKFNNIKTMIDTHNILLSNNNPIEDIETYYDYISHIHISEKKLAPIEECDFHYKLSEKIKEVKYNKVITYEVLKHSDIKLETFVKIYK